jgi:hypothetical protein
MNCEKGGAALSFDEESLAETARLAKGKRGKTPFASFMLLFNPATVKMIIGTV